MTTKIQNIPAIHPVPSLPSNSPFFSPEYRRIRNELSTLAARREPEEWQSRWQWEMPIIHLLIFDLIERVYAFADWAEEHDDLANYLGFAEIAIFAIYSHHETEETIIFPQWSKASGLDVWTTNVEQHHSFAKELDATWLYLRRCRSNLTPTPPPSSVPEPPLEIANIDLSVYHGLDPSKPFSPDALRAHMNTYLLSIARHLAEEIASLAPDYMEKVGEKNIKRIAKELQIHFSNYDPSWFLGMFLASLNPDTRKILLPLPWFVTWILVPFWWRSKNWGFWRYCAHPEYLTFWGKA